MSSFKARMLCFLLRNRDLLKNPFRKKTIDWNSYEAVVEFRQQVEKGAGVFGQLPTGITIEPIEINQMKAEWILPAQGGKDKVMLYFHGGGYISGTCRAHRSIVSKFVQGSKVGALLFEYRLAPEHRFPAALEDAVMAYRWLLEQGVAASQIVFVGDSAGGGLCLATLLALRDRGFSLPAAAVAYSPVTDFTCSGNSYQTNAKKCLAPEGTAPAFAKHYAGEQAVDNPYISPLFGDLQGLPSLLLYAGGDETLLDDATRFADKAQKAGVDVTLRIGEGLFHCYPACAPLFPEATQAMEDICQFIKARTA